MIWNTLIYILKQTFFGTSGWSSSHVGRLATMLVATTNVFIAKLSKPKLSFSLILSFSQPPTHPPSRPGMSCQAGQNALAQPSFQL